MATQLSITVPDPARAYLADEGVVVTHRRRLGRWPVLGVDRMPSVDVMRGSAMLLVILAHAAALIDPHTVPGVPYLLLTRVTSLASVAFVFVSGLMVSYFLESRPDRDTVVRRFARRALFLLLAVHPATWLACWFWSPGPASQLLTRWYITDTIAVCLVVGPVVMRRLGSRGRYASIAGLLVSAVALRAFWRPENPLLLLLQEASVGRPNAAPHPILACPVVPWMAVFLAGSIMGGSLAAACRTGGGLRELGGRIRNLGTVCIAAGVAATAVYKFLRWIQPDLWNPALLEAVHPDRTTILFPLYVGVLLWVFAWIIHRGHATTGFGRVAWLTAVLGRTSLFAFVAQFAVVWSLPAALGLRNQVTLLTLWPLAAGFVAVVWVSSYAYGRLTNRVQADDFRQFTGAAAAFERRVS